jgi:hypothetical protein
MCRFIGQVANCFVSILTGLAIVSWRDAIQALLGAFTRWRNCPETSPDPDRMRVLHAAGAGGAATQGQGTRNNMSNMQKLCRCMYITRQAGRGNRGVWFRDTQCFECRVCVPCVMRTGVLTIVCLGCLDMFHLVSSDTCDRTLEGLV